MTKKQVKQVQVKAAALAHILDMQPSIRMLDDVEALCIIERQLTNIGIRKCNYPMTERQLTWNDTRKENLKEEARTIADRYGCYFYYQSDPRGIAVWLVPKTIVDKLAAERGRSVDETLDQYYFGSGVSFSF
jgi:hypothetical protein